MLKSKLAVTSFVVGLLSSILTVVLYRKTLDISRIPGAVCFGMTFNSEFIAISVLLLGILVVICGIIAIIKIKKYKVGGKFFAITGIILGCICVVYSALWLVSVFSVTCVSGALY